MGYLIKLLTVGVLLSAPILCGILYGKHCIRRTKKRIEEHTRDRKSDMKFLDSRPAYYVKPEIVLEENRRVLRLNTHVEMEHQ